MENTKQTSVIPEYVRRNWPELKLDQKAWALACVALPNGTDSEKAQRAQEIKQSLQDKAWIWNREARERS